MKKQKQSDYHLREIKNEKEMVEFIEKMKSIGIDFGDVRQFYPKKPKK